jgi:hypothetical protein
MHLAIDATNRNELENASLWSTARPQARRRAEKPAQIYAGPRAKHPRARSARLEIFERL